jgi:hypothetical protein
MFLLLVIFLNPLLDKRGQEFIIIPKLFFQRRKSMKKTVLIMACLLGLGMILFTSCVSSGKAAKGQNYNALFPRTPKVDGSFDEPAWEGVTWEKDDHSIGLQPDGPDDASYQFAVVADMENIYVAVKIKDDVIQSNIFEWPDYYQEDSIEFFIDAGNEKRTTYDKNDAQVTIAAGNIGKGLLATKITEGKIDTSEGNLAISGKGIYRDLGVSAACIEAEGGWQAEIVIPLKNKYFELVPENGLVIGWGVQYNDDDAGSGRNHQVIWHVKDKTNLSWMQASVFSNLTFVKE